MPMRYAVESDVLSLTDVTNPGDEYDAIVRLENAMCDVFDHKTGTSFGAAPVAEARSVLAGPIGGTWYGFGWPLDYWSTTTAQSYRLILDMPLRSLTGIETGGTWNGTAWDDGTALTVDEYRLTNHTDQGYYAIDLTAGTWSGVVRITGVWADQVTASVPDDVAQALTEITVKEWHRRHMSPAGQIGPEGLAILPGNPWNLDYIKTVIDRYTVVELLV